MKHSYRYINAYNDENRDFHVKLQQNSAKRTVGYIVILVFFVLLLILEVATVRAADINDAQEIVDRSKVTYTSMARDKDFSWFRDNLKKLHRFNGYY